MTMRLVICFDGTWNHPDDTSDPSKSQETNVRRFYESVTEGELPDGSFQGRWYDTGVGTKWYDHVSGGAFGLGIDQKIQEGYKWLADKYPDPGDVEVFVVGFSRGAYSARSLVGMIRNVGLLKPGNEHKVPEAYALYRRRDDGADTDDAKRFRASYSRDIAIKFLGVWDTVGALGIPLPALQQLNAKEYAFHNMELSSIVQNAYHAVAIDEHRIDYQATLWAPISKPPQKVEQHWFVGAHADVGGGYSDRRLLSDITLCWMQQKASELGLALNNDPVCRPMVTAVNVLDAPHDSYREFIHGFYASTHPEYLREMHVGENSNEAIHPSVWDRIKAIQIYSPRNTGFPVMRPAPPDINP